MIIGGAIEVDQGDLAWILVGVGLVLLVVVALAGWVAWCLAPRWEAWLLGSVAFAVAAVASRSVFRLDGRNAPVIGLAASALVGCAFRASGATDADGRHRAGLGAAAVVALALLATAARPW